MTFSFLVKKTGIGSFHFLNFGTTFNSAKKNIGVIRILNYVSGPEVHLHNIWQTLDDPLYLSSALGQTEDPSSLIKDERVL